VTISTATSGATIYYTTNGTTPTNNSTVYSAPVTVSTIQTLRALATKSGYFDSTVAAATYTIGSGGGATTIGFGNGFTSGSLVLNGNAAISGTSLVLTTTAGTVQDSSAWFPTAVNIQNFTTDFQFQLSSGTTTADGFTWTLQNNSTAALGAAGGELGYTGIGKSVAVKFDLYNNSGEGVDSTGLYLNGVSPMTPAVDMTGTGIDLHSGDVFKVHLSYDGTNLAMTITDATTNATFTTTWAVNIPGTVGGNTAYAGFTGATGGLTAVQNILSWTTASSNVTGTVATPVFSPVGGTYSSAQTVSISDATSGATIYYTTNGTTPTTSSTVYTTPITVSTTESVEALGVKSGSTNSNVTTAMYTIQTQAAAPSLSGASPSSATQGQSNLAITLTGNNFLLGPACSFGSGIIINSCTYSSATKINANINVLTGAAIGSRDVTVTNSDGQTATLTNGFKVRRHH
jgi:hypothetical protein